MHLCRCSHLAKITDILEREAYKVTQQKVVELICALSFLYCTLPSSRPVLLYLGPLVNRKMMLALSSMWHVLWLLSTMFQARYLAQWTVDALSMWKPKMLFCQPCVGHIRGGKGEQEDPL